MNFYSSYKFYCCITAMPPSLLIVTARCCFSRLKRSHVLKILPSPPPFVCVCVFFPILYVTVEHSLACRLTLPVNVGGGRPVYCFIFLPLCWICAVDQQRSIISIFWHAERFNHRMEAAQCCRVREPCPVDNEKRRVRLLCGRGQ